MNSIEFISYLSQVTTQLNTEINNALEEAAGEIEAQTKLNTKVKTGRTRASWQHRVDEGAHKAYIGSNYDNAIWEEFGTGIYSQHGNGRKTPWVYCDEQGNWYTTRGKKPRKMLQTAFKTTKNMIESYFKERFKGL